MTNIILLNKQQINFILKIFILFITFIFLIKEESETNKYVECSDYSEKTYSEFVVDLSDIPVSLFLKYYDADTYQNQNTPFKNVSIPLNQSTLQFSIHYFFDNFYNLSPIFIPKTKIVKILHKKNICHKSSDDNPALSICC